MSSANVKVRASSSRNKTQPTMSKMVSSDYYANHQEVDDIQDDGQKSASHTNDDVTMKAAYAPDDNKTEQEKSTSPTSDDAVKSRSSTFDSIIKKVKPCFDKHRHAIVYGIIGIVAAILILTIGFWPVFLLAVFAAIGIAIGKFRDSGTSMQSAARFLTNNLRR